MFDPKVFITSLMFRYICLTCLGYLKKNKLPAMSVLNNLQLHYTDQQLKNLGLKLTELEAVLVAPNILFQKIYELPKSRWTSLDGRVVNVPISKDSRLSTIEQMKLPRTPLEGEVIIVELKRKKEYKGSVYKELVNADRMYHFLMKMKEWDNPHFSCILDPADYKENCKETDPTGFELIFGEVAEEEDCVEQFDKEEDVIMKEVVDELNDEDEEKKKDPIRKNQFIYDENVALAPMFPEMNVAPGENHIPKSILNDNDWDVKSFPHLHNFDGSNGKDQTRKVKLTSQKYFLQRVCNKDTRFAKNANYLFASVAFLEEKQICYNISIVGMRGKKKISAEGQVSYELEDLYRFMESVPNTLKYWQKCKYELIAKMDNFGPFSVFFTLSCADTRWEANYVDILRDLGYLVRIHTNQTDGDTELLYEASTDGMTWKPFENFIKEDVDVSQHELVRKNVVTATR